MTQAILAAVTILSFLCGVLAAKGRYMAIIDDLTKAVSDLQTAATSAEMALSAAKANAVDPAAAAGIVQSIQRVTDGLNAAVSPPAPPPPVAT